MKPICRVTKHGIKYWHLNNQLHREDGPAAHYANGTKEWWINGKRHRENGPAIEWAYGYKEWWYNGKHIDCKDNQEFLRMIKLMVFL